MEDWPPEVAIISAYATTGETWTEAENTAADGDLEAVLRERGGWIRRITGFSPDSGHAEPSWAVPMSLDEACDVGLKFRQDAVYFVSRGQLFVSFCDARRELIVIGPFRQRLHQSTTQ